MPTTEIITEKLQKRLVKKAGTVEREVYEEVLKLLREFDIADGKFVPGERANRILNELNKRLREIIQGTAIEDEIREFIDDFDQIDANIKATQQAFNGIQVPNSILTNGKQWAIDNTVNSLLQARVDNAFVIPIKQALYSRIAFGSGVRETEAIIRQAVLGGDGRMGAFQQWIGQIARDTINQYQGTINAEIKVKYELNAIRYVGGLVEDSRPQCERWILEFGGLLRDDQLEAEIRWAYRNGSGMIPDTTPENFPQRRGGYNCRHEAIPVRVRN